MSLSNTAVQGAEDIERQRKRAQNVRRFTTRFRVLIIGRANAGKTTILQRVCHTTEQPKVFNRHGHEIDVSELDPTAKRGEHDIENEMIFKSNTAFIFHDSRGFEAGSISELNKVRDFVEKHSNYQSIGNHLHVIWYCIPINDEARPITRAELNFFDECGTGRVPVIVLFTKADLLDAQTMEHLVDGGMDVEDAAIRAPEESVAQFLKKFGQQLYKKKYPPKEHVFFRDMQNPASDCSELLTKTAGALSDDTVLQLFLTVLQNYVSLSIEHAIIRVVFASKKLFKRRREWREMVENILNYFPHMKKQNDDATAFNLDADDNFDDAFFFKNRIPVEDVLNYTGWPFILNAKTFEDIAFLCITTAIIAENSYFLWKQKASASSAPFKLAIQNFNSSVDLEKIKTSIKDASRLKTKDQKPALVKIAMDNRISL